MTPDELRNRAADCECIHCKEALRDAASEIERFLKALYETARENHKLASAILKLDPTYDLHTHTLTRDRT